MPCGDLSTDSGSTVSLLSKNAGRLPSVLPRGLCARIFPRARSDDRSLLATVEPSG